jgi:hypothetical protein
MNTLQQTQPMVLITVGRITVLDKLCERAECDWTLYDRAEYHVYPVIGWLVVDCDDVSAHALVNHSELGLISERLIIDGGESIVSYEKPEEAESVIAADIKKKNECTRAIGGRWDTALARYIAKPSLLEEALTDHKQQQEGG